MDLSKSTRAELIALCRERNIKGYSSKKKNDIIALLTAPPAQPVQLVDIAVPVPPVAQPEDGLRMIDLFAGTGAFTHALEATGRINCVFANDMVEWSKTIYDANHGHALTLGNLNDIDVNAIPEHDIMTGGFRSRKAN